MVLDNAASQQEPAFSDSVPSSDLDPYADTDTINPATRSVIRVTPPGSPAVYVNLDNLPRRWSLLTTKAHHPMLPKGITESCRYAQEILGRPVKQEEADALAYHFAKSIRVGSYGTPVGVALGTLQAVRTQSKFRFPGGFSPLNHHRFSADRLGPLRNQAARTGWQMMRIAAYWSVGGVLGGILFAMYGISSGAAGRSLDPRLREFAEALKRKAESRSGVLPAGRQVDQSDGPRRDETMEMARQRRTAQGAWGRQRQQQQGGGGGGEGGGDDMSPTGGAFQEDFVQSGSDTGLMDDGQMQAQEYRQRANARESPTENNQNTYDYSRMKTQTKSADQQASQSAQDSTRRSGGGGSGGGGGAWDKIRQGALSNTSTRPNTQQQQQSRSTGDSSGASFNFSPGDEDKQLAKSEAQRDFDARVERERAGKDFEEQGDRSGRRW